MSRKLAGIALHGGIPWLRALRFGVAAGVEHLAVLRSLGEVWTVVDIGANHGQFALAARHSLPQARIVSFEPLPGPAGRFRRVFGGDPRATLFEVAIGPEAGEATIHVSRRDDSSSLLPIAAMQDRLFPGTAEAETQQIQVGRLADFLSQADVTPPALLKIDVQGFELQALAGCDELLTRFAWLYVECSFVELYAGQPLADEVIAWLRGRCFRLGGVHNTTYDRSGRAIQADFLFERTSDDRTDA